MEMLDCPIEILEFIAEETMPEGFEGFALTCRTMYDATGKFCAKHNRLRQRYRYFDYDLPRSAYGHNWDSESNSEKDAKILCHTPLQLIRQIAEEPLIARYIIAAHLGGPCIPNSISVRQNQIDKVKSTPSFLSLLQSSPYLEATSLEPSFVYDTLLSRFSDGKAGLLLSLLLTLLLNLINISFPAHVFKYGFESMGQQLMDVVIERANDPNHPDASLSKLSSVVASSHFLGSFEPIGHRHLSHYLSIKSLHRHVYASDADTQKYCTLNSPVLHNSERHYSEGPTNNPGTLVLFGHYVSGPEITHMLSDIPQLKTLKICSLMRTRPYTTTGRSKRRHHGSHGVMNAIQDLLGDTLEELHFMCMDSEKEGGLLSKLCRSKN